ncbi:helix-turn-helix transcriptional regulator [Paludibacterium yongneupense]|uniref:helix-turn-helix transcriptional regulator n=1 Tax=Paludibacterium yongneupense TaxID=400061 RepID=UPI0004223D71|nr:helix-turn-helix transcriptional regulator [Paludibacterium yongneupense]
MNTPRQEIPVAAKPQILEPQRVRELGMFLRARRESLDPQRLGLPRTGRRRTPGLRREEVAQLADVGVTWYTWLEQGRPIQASAQVLGAIARALQCSEAETRHLFILAGMSDAFPRQGPSCEHLGAASQAVLEHLDPLPALIQNARFDILGFTPAYCRLVGVDLERIARRDRNCIYLALTDANWRACMTDWDEIMPRMVAFFRASMADHMGEPAWEEQLQRYFDVSPEFSQIWQRYEVRGIENYIKRFHNDRVGEMRMHQTNWWSAPKNGDRLLVYVPEDEASRDAFERLLALPFTG